MERKIGIIEDMPEFKEYMRNILNQNKNFQIHCFSSAEEFMENGISEKYDLVYLDINLKQMSGLDLMKYVNTNGYEHKFVILSTIFSDSIIFEALENGAYGYYLKSEVSDLLNITNIFLNGESIITPTIAFHVQRSLKKNSAPGLETLSESDENLLQEMIKGLTLEEVASSSSQSIHSLRTQISLIYSKLKANHKYKITE